MKKLFSTMLAATMVAGMAVTSFAATATKDITSNDFSYGLVGAYDKDGKELGSSSSKLQGGDKIYFPILVSGDELLDQKDNTSDDAGDKIVDDNMYYATKASEVKTLKASVKDEIGGKYIDSASIVKKDISIPGKTTPGAEAVPGKFTAEATLPAGVVEDSVSVTGDALNKNGAVEVTVTADKENENKLTLAYGEATQVIEDKTAELEADLDVTLGDVSFKIAKDSVKDLKETIKLGTVEGYKEAGKDTAETIGKIYCVEVKIADYFKNSETEVDFNIKLKDGGKTAFDTDDDALAGSGFFFNGTFDLGSDSEIFNLKDAGKNEQNGAKAKKFKNGDLEIEIGKNTKTLKLDEAITAKGDTEDVTSIYIENDKTIDSAFSFDVKASGQDDLYLELNQDADKEISLANPKADLTFFNFPGDPEFDFAGLATFGVDDEDEDYYFYEIVDGEIKDSKAKYNDEDGVFELRTSKLSSYVISDRELEATEAGDKDKDTDKDGNGSSTDKDKDNSSNGDKDNANTGAADLIGVASALAVVSIVAAGAVAFKK